jgi:hypothetical protein
MWLQGHLQGADKQFPATGQHACALVAVPCQTAAVPSLFAHHHIQNVTLDLSEHKNLYYLNPLDLLSIVRWRRWVP